MSNLKSYIKDKSRFLFCKMGVANVTLREVANHLNKSYGNITYHYPNKKVLLQELFEDFMEELLEVQAKIETLPNSFSIYKSWPVLYFALYKKYAFFISDHLEISRKYQETKNEFALDSMFISVKKKALLNALQNEGILLRNLNEQRFDHILELEKAITIFYFQSELHPSETDYRKKMNWILYPYLSDKGKIKYIRS